MSNTKDNSKSGVATYIRDLPGNVITAIIINFIGLTFISFISIEVNKANLNAQKDNINYNRKCVEVNANDIKVNTHELASTSKSFVDKDELDKMVDRVIENQNVHNELYREELVTLRGELHDLRKALILSK